MFIPVKIVSRKYAEKLLDGDVFMRPLSEFGSWDKESEINDKNRRDYMEGAVATYDKPNDVGVLNGLDPNFKKLISHVTLIDGNDLPYFKVFCMYCLELDASTGEPISPDSRIAGFGDTAVVFRDFNEFLLRWGKAIVAKYENSIEFIDRIRYFQLGENRQLNPMFEKVSGFSYQNELRIAFVETEYNKFAIGPSDGKDYRMVLDKKSVTINVGDLRDVAYIIPIERLLDTSGIVGSFLCPSNNDPEQPTFYDKMVEATRVQMKDYKSILVSPIITINGDENIRKLMEFKS